MPSTRDLSALPDVEPLRRLLQSLAMLDAIVCPEWEYRYYSFNAGWYPEGGEQMGSMRNGCGDDFFALLTPAGCFRKGFTHEAPMSPYASDPPAVWPGLLEEVPGEFASALTEPAFKMTDTTFCLWRRFGDPRWQHGPVVFPEGPDPDGSAALLDLLDGRPESYREWAENYYEQEIPLDAVRHIYAHRPLATEILAELNPDMTLQELEDDLREIGYPS